MHAQGMQQKKWLGKLLGYEKCDRLGQTVAGTLRVLSPSVTLGCGTQSVPATCVPATSLHLLPRGPRQHYNRADHSTKTSRAREP